MTITLEKIQQLLSQSEGPTLDFKEEPHGIANDGKKAEFIKDILAMANTPRENDSYIIIGVRKTQDGRKQIKGVNSHPDDATLQDILNNAAIQPSKPLFYYHDHLEIEGKSIGVIEIPKEENRNIGPFCCGKKFAGLETRTYYYRRGSKNEEASTFEERRIHKWFQGQTHEESQKNHQATVPTNWDLFYSECQNFNGKYYDYLLITGPQTLQNDEALGLLGNLPLSLVLDFDPDTADKGAYFYAKEILAQRCSPHLLTYGDPYSLVSGNTTYWFAAKGISGRPSTLTENDNRSWLRKYIDAIRNLITNFSKISNKPLIVVCLWDQVNYIRQIFEIIDTLFQDRIIFVFASSETENVEELVSAYEIEPIDISFENILIGVRQYINSPTDYEILAPSLPKIESSSHILSKSDLNWLSEDLEVIHSDIERQVRNQNAFEETYQVGRDFLRGKSVTWLDLIGDHDATREKTDLIKKQVELDLKNRITTRINLNHFPGAGGTTVGRSIAWELRNRYPTVLVKRIRIGETVARLRKIFEYTSMAILAVIEGADIVPDRLEQLYTEVKAENIPVVFLMIIRRFEKNIKETERSYYIRQDLSINEALRLIAKCTHLSHLNQKLYMINLVELVLKVELLLTLHLVGPCAR